MLVAVTFSEKLKKYKIQSLFFLLRILLFSKIVMKIFMFLT